MQDILSGSCEDERLAYTSVAHGIDTDTLILQEEVVAMESSQTLEVRKGKWTSRKLAVVATVTLAAVLGVAVAMSNATRAPEAMHHSKHDDLLTMDQTKKPVIAVLSADMYEVYDDDRKFMSAFSAKFSGDYDIVTANVQEDMDSLYSAMAQSDAIVWTFTMLSQRAGTRSQVREVSPTIVWPVSSENFLKQSYFAGTKHAFVYLIGFESQPNTEEVNSYNRWANKVKDQKNMLFKPLQVAGGMVGDKQKFKMNDIAYNQFQKYDDFAALAQKIDALNMVHKSPKVGATGDTIECTVFNSFGGELTFIPNYKYRMYADGVRSDGFMVMDGPAKMNFQNRVFRKDITIRFENSITVASGWNVVIYNMDGRTLAAAATCEQANLKASVPLPESKLMVGPGANAYTYDYGGNDITKEAKFYTSLSSTASWSEVVTAVTKLFGDDLENMGMNLYMFSGSSWNELDEKTFNEKKSSLFPLILVSAGLPRDSYRPEDVEIPA